MRFFLPSAAAAAKSGKPLPGTPFLRPEGVEETIADRRTQTGAAAASCQSCRIYPTRLFLRILPVRFLSLLGNQSQIFFGAREVHVFLPDAEPSLLIADRPMTDRTDPLHDDLVLPGIGTAEPAASSPINGNSILIGCLPIPRLFVFTSPHSPTVHPRSTSQQPHRP